MPPKVLSRRKRWKPEMALFTSEENNRSYLEPTECPECGEQELYLPAGYRPDGTPEAECEACGWRFEYESAEDA